MKSNFSSVSTRIKRLAEVGFQMKHHKTPPSRQAAKTPIYVAAVESEAGSNSE